VPTYEYRCEDCRKRASLFFTYAEYGTKQPVCPHCGSLQLRRLITRVRVATSEESRMDRLADPSAWGGIDENDPKSVAQMMRRMGSEMGEDMGPEFHEAVDRLEAGENPEDIEKSVPGLGGGDNSSGGMDDWGTD
jgi:putative FmdB family regulatory protein